MGRAILALPMPALHQLRHDASHSHNLTRAVHCPAACPSGAFLAMGTATGALLVWDLRGGAKEPWFLVYGDDETWYHTWLGAPAPQYPPLVGGCISVCGEYYCDLYYYISMCIPYQHRLTSEVSNPSTPASSWADVNHHHYPASCPLNLLGC